MPKRLVAVVMALAATGAMARAETTTTGSITFIDTRIMAVTLDDGNSYELPVGFKTASLRVGEKVEIQWNRRGHILEAERIKPLD